MVVIDEKDVEIKNFSEVSEKLRNDWNEIIEKILLMCNKKYVERRVYEVILKCRSKFDVFNELFINTHLARELVSKDVISWCANIKNNMQDLRSQNGKKEDYKKTSWKVVEEYIYRFLPELKPLIDTDKFEQVDKIANTTDINRVYIEFYRVLCYKIEIIKILIELLIEKNEKFLSEIKAIEEQTNKKYLNVLNEKEKSIQALQRSLEAKNKHIAELENKIKTLTQKENILNEKEKEIR